MKYWLFENERDRQIVNEEIEKRREEGETWKREGERMDLIMDLEDALSFKIKKMYGL